MEGEKKPDNSFVSFFLRQLITAFIKFFKTKNQIDSLEKDIGNIRQEAQIKIRKNKLS